MRDPVVRNKIRV